MMVFKLSYRISEVQELVDIAPVYPQFHPWLLCLLLHYIWGTEKKKKRFWDSNLRIAGSMNCMLSLMATWLHCSELHRDQPARNYQNAGKREWEWRWLAV